MKPSPRFLKVIFAIAILTLIAGLSIPAGGGLLPDWLLFLAILVITAIAFGGFRLQVGWTWKSVRRAVFAFGLFLACASAWIPELGAKFPPWVWTLTGLSVFAICLLGTIDFLHEESHL